MIKLNIRNRFNPRTAAKPCVGFYVLVSKTKGYVSWVKSDMPKYPYLCIKI